MIERYSLPEIAKVWSLENKYRTWLKVELAVCTAYNKIGKIPDSSYENIIRKAKFNVNEIQEIENVTKHDVIAFLTNVAKYVGEDSRFIHLGLTSSDVGDTSFSLLLKESLESILKKTEFLRESLRNQAVRYKHTPVMGRTHGIHAEPVTFGFKLLIFYEEIKRAEERIKSAIKSVSFGKLSGAVGNYANISPEVEQTALDILGLKHILSNQAQLFFLLTNGKYLFRARGVYFQATL